MLRWSLVLFGISVPTLAHSNPKFEIWKSIPRGANVFSEISMSDLRSARSHSIRLLRMGAVGQHQDLRWLVRRDRFDVSPNNLARLRAVVSQATRQGFSVVLTLSELPGRRWRYGQKDYRLWESAELQEEFVRGWRKIASVLKNDSGVVGYDLINEPDLQRPADFVKLNQLYARAIAAIRSVDQQTPIVLQPAGMGSVDALEHLADFDDPFLIYSFHYYDPWVYFSKKKNRGKLRYPGLIPRWISKGRPGPTDEWSLRRHQARLGQVKAWAAQRSIQPYQIFVGEFGVWREADGADQYLRDVLSIFTAMGWPWAYYAYREEGWDNADLEKGPLDPFTLRPVLFDLIRTHFRL